MEISVSSLVFWRVEIEANAARRVTLPAQGLQYCQIVLFRSTYHEQAAFLTSGKSRQHNKHRQLSLFIVL